MAYEINVEREEPRPLAVALGGSDDLDDLADEIYRLLTAVWEFIRARGLDAGNNVVVYLHGTGAIEAGVEVFEDFEGDGEVKPSATPAGEAASTRHWGAYDDLPDAHEALRAWCDDNGRTPAGPAWEVYGDWDPDPENRYTDVYLLLEPLEGEDGAAEDPDATDA